jgi:CHAT domain-containing protein
MTAARLLLIAVLLAGLQAFHPARAAGAAPDELEAAIALYRSRGAEIALPEFQALNAHYAREGDRLNEARAERYIGESHWQLGQYDKSRLHLETALAAMRNLGHREGEGKILNVLGLLAWDLGRYDEAKEHFAQASLIGQELGDRRLAGSTLNNLSLVYDELGDYPTSLEQYQRALQLYEGADFPRGESDTLGNIGGLYLLLGRYREALGYYQRALAISESLDSRASMSLDHGNLAQCYLGLGRTDAALAHFDTALQLAVQAGMRKEEALWQRGRGNALIQKGRYDEGLEHHRTALAIYEEIGARGAQLDAVHDLGRVYLLLGDLLSAEQYFRRGAATARELGAARVLTANLLALGDLQSRRDRPVEADALYRQALQRATDAGELNHQAESLLRLSLLHRGQGRLDAAESEARRALEIAGETDAAWTAAEAWLALGELARLREQPGPALKAYDSALEAMQAAPDPDLLWQVRFGRAQALIQQGERVAAVAELQAAVRVIEGVRERLREERFRSGYVQDKHQVYISLVRLQLELGLVEDAFSSAQRMRARNFLEQLEAGEAVNANEDERLHEFALRERIKQLQGALQEEQNRAPHDRRQLAVDSFSAELMAAEREYQAFLDDVKSHSVIGRAAAAPAPAEVLARLRPGEALIEYLVGDGQVMIFLLKPDGMSAAVRQSRRIDLMAKVNLVRDLIQEPSGNFWRAPALSLSESLLAPLWDEGLLERVSHLYVVPHGFLNYLPFAMLPLGPGDDGRVVIEQFTLAYLPAAVTLTLDGPAETVDRSMLALAPERSRLEHTLREAKSIAGIFRPDARLLSGPAATETAFKAEAGGYRLLHLSTHGYFNVNNPLLSGLELEPDEENDGLLEVHEILNLSLHARLVTLSACDTGLGSGWFNRIPAGDEFVGLTRAFLLAGSRSVLATLWQVDDRSTLELMEGFYERLNPQGTALGRAQALAQVQRELKKSNEHNHPFYWAPFVLVGQQDQPRNVRS